MTKRRCIFSALLALFAVVSAFPQGYKGQGRISGSVTDQDGNPLENVKVKLFSVKGQAGFETQTAKDGQWKAFYVRGGAWNIDFEKPGYLPRKISVEIKEFDKNKPIEIALEKMEGLVITEELKAELGRGNALFDEQKYEEAVAVYLNIINANPEAYIINKNIGNCHFQMQDYEKAEEYYLKVLEKDSQDAEIMLLIGNCYANRGENDKAMDWYNKIDFEKITDPMVLFNIGSTFSSQSNFDQALKYYLRAVELKSDFLDALYQLGLTYLAVNNQADAITTFENYIKYDESSERAGQVRGFLEFLKKK